MSDKEVVAEEAKAAKGSAGEGLPSKAGHAPARHVGGRRVPEAKMSPGREMALQAPEAAEPSTSVQGMAMSKQDSMLAELPKIDSGQVTKSKPTSSEFKKVHQPQGASSGRANASGFRSQNIQMQPRESGSQPTQHIKGVH